MKGLDTIAQVVEFGTTAEATLAVASVFPDIVQGDKSPIDDITLASQIVGAFGLSWARRQDAVIAVYDQHDTGMRVAFHPLAEIPTSETMTEPRALTLAALKSIPVSRPYLLADRQEKLLTQNQS